MTTAPHNILKQRLKMGEKTRGVWLDFHADAVAEMAGHSGADWCLIDGEHAPFDPATILQQVRVLAGTPAATIVRLPDDQIWMIKQVLDMGVQNLMVPMVETAEQAQAIVSACRYPPQGVRGVGFGVARAGGYGRLPDYARNADAELMIIVQAEAGRAIDNIEAIAAVEGIDGIFIGPADLAADLGRSAEETVPVIEDALGRIAAAGAAPGVLTNVTQAGRYEACGSRFTGVANDTRMMFGALQAVFG